MNESRLRGHGGSTCGSVAVLRVLAGGAPVGIVTSRRRFSARPTSTSSSAASSCKAFSSGFACGPGRLERGFQFTDDRADPHPGGPPPGCELLVQNAQGVGEAAGPLAVSPPGFTILDPLWASLLGLFLFGERIRTGALDLVVEALALTLIIAGVTAGFAGPESRARRTSAPATVSVTPPARRRPLCDHPQPNPGLRNLRLDRIAA